MGGGAASKMLKPTTHRLLRAAWSYVHVVAGAGAGDGDDVDIWCLGRGWEHRARQLRRLEEDMDSTAASVNFARKFQSKLQVLLQPLSFQVDNLRLAGQRHQTPGGALAAGG